VLAYVVSRLVVSIWCAAALAGGCHRQPAAKAPVQEKAISDAALPIGTATMAGDGAITLDLHSPDGAEGRLIYPPSHKQYDAIKRHLPGLKPGGSVVVSPWPDQPAAK